MVRAQHRLILALLLVSLALVLAACGSGPRSASGQAAQTGNVAADDGEVVVVTIKNFKFEPAHITVAPGTRVRFVNEDPTPHNVVQGTVADVGRKDHTPLFESPELQEGQSWEYVFDTEGEFAYVCTVAGHYLMGMVGSVTVTADSEAVAAAAASVPNTEPTDAEVEHDHTHDAAPALSMQALVDAYPDLYSLKPEGLVELQPFRVEGNVKEFALDIQEVQHELIDGVVVTAWAFNGILPGPTIRVQEGDIVRVHFTNTHHQPHTIHWHGIYADQEHDGVPHTSAAVMPGETRVYEWVAEAPGTYWYHCHVDSYRHVDMGMYGAIIIEPKDPEAVTWANEYTLILDDWDSNVDAMATRYEPNHNYFLLNGRAFPDVPTLTLKVGETTRIRLINAAYSNVAMHMHGPSFMVVESDGKPVPLPYEKDTLDIAPGERYDIEVTPRKAGLYPFHAHNLRYVTNDGMYPGGMHLMLDIRP